MDKPEVGQVVYRLPIGNAARRGNVELTPVTVTKVGRKFFYVGEGWRQQKYEIGSGVEFAGDYTPSYRIYQSPQHWEDQKEASDIVRELAQAFRGSSARNDLTLLDLRAIKAIIDAREQCG